MEAINFITQWTEWLFLIIPAAAAAMVTYQSVRKSLTSDDATINECNLKIKHTIIGSVIGVTINSVISILKAFYN